MKETKLLLDDLLIASKSPVMTRPKSWLLAVEGSAIRSLTTQLSGFGTETKKLTKTKTSIGFMLKL
jgi:hypothetical protein